MGFYLLNKDKKLKVLIACEESGTVRDYFIEAGHDAISCDLKPTRKPGPHYQGNVFDIINDGFDLMIAHPPCTYLTVTGNKWMKPEYENRFPTRKQDRKDAIEFFMKISNAPIQRIAIENPIGIMSTEWRKPEQVIQPYYFGDADRKSTCLWLKNLPRLVHYKKDNLFGSKTHVTPDIITFKSGATMSRCHYETSLLPLGQRAEPRSVTFKGIAKAMVEQWGSLPPIVPSQEDCREYSQAELFQ